MTRQSLYRLLVICSIVLLWGGLFGASLAVANLDLGHFSALCGAWGCLPPTAPLISVHMMWLTLIVGGAWLSRLAVPFLHGSEPWFGMTLAAACATLILLGFDAYTYVDGGGNVTDVGRRALYRLITWTDLPLLQVVFACGVNWSLAGSARRSQLRSIARCARDDAHDSPPVSQLSNPDATI